MEQYTQVLEFLPTRTVFLTFYFEYAYSQEVVKIGRGVLQTLLPGSTAAHLVTVSVVPKPGHRHGCSTVN